MTLRILNRRKELKRKENIENIAVFPYDMYLLLKEMMERKKGWKKITHSI